MPDTPSVLYLAINLPRAAERRESLTRQAERLGIRIDMVPAVAGTELPEDTTTCGYDKITRRKAFSNDLLPNEIACALSHRKALRTFLDSGADYAVVLEDDALLSENFNEGLHELFHHLSGWQVAKLFTADGRLFPLLPQKTGGCIEPVFPKKLPWVAVGYLYSRAAAQTVYEKLGRFWLPADAQIGRILLDEVIPTIGVSPSLVVSADPNNEQSTLDADGARRAERPKRSLLQYIRYRASVLHTAFAKRRMRKKMSKLLSHR